MVEETKENVSRETIKEKNPGSLNIAEPTNTTFNLQMTQGATTQHFDDSQLGFLQQQSQSIQDQINKQSLGLDENVQELQEVKREVGKNLKLHLRLEKLVKKIQAIQMEDIPMAGTPSVKTTPQTPQRIKLQ